MLVTTSQTYNDDNTTPLDIETLVTTTAREKRTWSPARREAQKLVTLKKQSLKKSNSGEKRTWSPARREAFERKKRDKNAAELENPDPTPAKKKRWTFARRAAHERKKYSYILTTDMKNLPVPLSDETFYEALCKFYRFISLKRFTQEDRAIFKSKFAEFEATVVLQIKDLEPEINIDPAATAVVKMQKVVRWFYRYDVAGSMEGLEGRLNFLDRHALASLTASLLQQYREVGPSFRFFCSTLVPQQRLCEPRIGGFFSRHYRRHYRPLRKSARVIKSERLSRTPSGRCSPQQTQELLAEKRDIIFRAPARRVAPVPEYGPESLVEDIFMHAERFGLQEKHKIQLLRLVLWDRRRRQYFYEVAWARPDMLWTLGPFETRKSMEVHEAEQAALTELARSSDLYEKFLLKKTELIKAVNSETLKIVLDQLEERKAFQVNMPMPAPKTNLEDARAKVQEKIDAVREMKQPFTGSLAAFNYDLTPSVPVSNRTKLSRVLITTPSLPSYHRSNFCKQILRASASSKLQVPALPRPGVSAVHWPLRRRSFSLRKTLLTVHARSIEGKYRVRVPMHFIKRTPYFHQVQARLHKLADKIEREAVEETIEHNRVIKIADELIDELDVLRWFRFQVQLWVHETLGLRDEGYFVALKHCPLENRYERKLVHESYFYALAREQKAHLLQKSKLPSIRSLYGTRNNDDERDADTALLKSTLPRLWSLICSDNNVQDSNISELRVYFAHNVWRAFISLVPPPVVIETEEEEDDIDLLNCLRARRLLLPLYRNRGHSHG